MCARSVFCMFWQGPERPTNSVGTTVELMGIQIAVYGEAQQDMVHVPSVDSSLF